MHLPPYSVDRTRTDPGNNLTSTADTIHKMIGLVQQNVNAPVIQEALQEILIHVRGSRNPADLCRAVYWWTKQNVQFDVDESTMQRLFGITDFEDGKELLLSPSFLLQMNPPIGDCDDFSTLIATLLIAAGVHNVYFCTIAADSNDPEKFTHVYVRVILPNGQQFPLDASHGKYPGWETAQQFKQVNWKVPVVATAPSTVNAPVVAPQYAPVVQNFLTSQVIQNVPMFSSVFGELSSNPFLAAIGI